MSNRRTAASTAAKRDSRPATDYRHGSGNVTRAQRDAAADGIRAGAIQRLRAAAAEHVSRVDAMAAAGVTLPPAPYLLGTDWLDPETGEERDAREVLAAAETAAAERAAKRKTIRATLAELPADHPDRDKLTGKLAALSGGTVGRYSPRDETRMTHRDAATIAAYAARCMARMSRPAMSESEQMDAECAAMLALMERGSGTFPRWDALSADADAAAQGYDQNRARDRWRGWAYLTARAMSRTRHERLSAEQPADWTDAGEDAPTPEQAAAMLADAAAAEVATALEAVEGSTVDALAATAPGDTALSAPERDALMLRLAGVTRAQLAAMRGVKDDAAKKSAQRGGKALAARVPDAAAARQWARAAAAEDRDGWDAAAALIRDRVNVMSPALPVYRGVRLSWPDRLPIIGPDAAYSVPSAPSGKGSSARAALAAAAQPYRLPRTAYRPRRTRSGAPALAPHRLLARAARAHRTLAALEPRPVSTLDTAAAAPLIRTAPPLLHPAKIAGKEADQMRADAAAKRARALRWIAPGYGA